MTPASPQPGPTQARADRVARVLASSAILLSLIVLAFWVVRVWEPLALGARWAPIAPMTALMMIAASVAILRTPDARASTRGLRDVCASVGLVGLGAMLAVYRHVSGIDNPFERWLSGQTGHIDGMALGRTAIHAAIPFAVLAVAMLAGVRPGRVRRFAPLLHVSVLLVALTVLQGYLLDAPLLYGGRAIPLAGLTALGLTLQSMAGLLVAGVDEWPLRAVLGLSTTGAANRPSASFLTLSGFVAAFVLASGAFWYTGAHARAHDQRLAELDRIAAAKSMEITEWIDGHLATARALQRMPLGTAEIERLTRRAEEPGQVDVLTEFVRDEDFAAAVLFDSTGRVLYGAPAASAQTAAMHRVRELRVTQRPRIVMDDLRQRDGQTLLELWVPLGAGPESRERALAWLMLSTNADSTLFTAIRRTTLPGSTSTIGLWHLEADSLRALGAQRADLVTRGRPAFPISKVAINSIIAQGEGGAASYFGPDSRGVDVVASVRKIDGTSWFLIMQMDNEEIHQTDLWLAVRLSLVLAVVLLTTIAGAHSISSGRELAAATRELAYVRQRERDVEELRRSEDRYARAVRGTTDGLWDWDLETNEYYFSPRLRELIGLSAEDEGAGADEFLSRVHPEDRARVDAAFEEHIAGRAPYSIEMRMRRPNGTYRWFWSRGEVERDANGKPTRFAGALTDITEQRESNELLRLFRETIERSQDAIFVLDVARKRVVDSNAAAQALLGYSAAEMLELSPLAFAVEVSDERTWHAAVEAIRSGRGNRRRTMLRRRDGSVFPVEASVSSITSGGRELLLTIARDITDRVRDEEERAQLQEQFLRSQRLESVGRLAGGVAHDFNNLLTVINTTAEMARKDTPPDSRVRADLAQILEAGERAALLTRQLLAFSLQQVLRPELLDLNEVVTDFLKMIERVIGEDIRINVQTHNGGAFVQADRGQLEQVLMNLSLNSRDAMSGGGTLTIDVDLVHLTADEGGHDVSLPPGRYVRLSVSDVGEGMSPEVRSKVFEPFFTTKAPGRGTGLGLPTAYGIIKQSGGDISVESEPGRGTTIRVYLPPASADAEAAPDSGAALVMSGHGTETVLMVEDEESIRFVVRRVLERAGYTVLEASNGNDALELLASLRILPDLVMTDLVMPGISGIVLAHEIRRRWPHVPILLATGYSQETVSREFDALTEWRLIAKPYAVNDLLREVRSILDQQPV